MSYLSLLEYLNNNRIEYCTEVDASQLVSIKIGGNVSLAVYPRSILELVNIVERLRGQRYFILGNGTNCYFSSNGYDGVVIGMLRDSVEYPEDGYIYDVYNTTDFCLFRCD